MENEKILTYLNKIMEFAYAITLNDESGNYAFTMADEIQNYGSKIIELLNK